MERRRKWEVMMALMQIVGRDSVESLAAPQI